jgi:glycosyltransferase
MKVSIVTATYNSQQFIADCVRSIHEQTHKDIEHIIIDGASRDDTIRIIENMPNKVTKIVSEPDKGIYDAMNKGLKLVTGDIVGILNSDDFYNSNDVITKVVDAFQETNADCVYGNLYYVLQDNPDIIKRKWVTGLYNPKRGFKMGWHPAHPSFFVKRELYERYGNFDEDFKISADFELMLRFIEKHHAKSAYVDFPMVRMRLGGESNKSLKNSYLGNKDCYMAFKRNNLQVSIFYPFMRLIPKLKQYI